MPIAVGMLRRFSTRAALPQPFSAVELFAMYSNALVRSHENRSVEVNEELKLVGLSDLDLESCDVSETWKEKLTDLVLKYEDVFSRHYLDCGEAKVFVHRIRLVDDKPVRIPFRRVPPAEYQKLKHVLDEMEEREIIRKSTSEYASPLVLVWKKNGNLRGSFTWPGGYAGLGGACFVSGETGKQDMSAVVNEELGVRATLPPYTPSSPVSSHTSLSSMESRIKVRLARLELEAKERAEAESEFDFKLAVCKMALEREKEIG
ncbi:hypothetical protein AOLI_G00096160 [Acnodon oligacanthus]